LGLIAVAVGWLVGKGIQWGTGGRGGILYQLLGVFITYFAIAAAYVPQVLQPETEGSGPLLVGLAEFVLSAPFQIATHSIFGAIVIGIGLYEAWMINKGVTLAITGPFHTGFGGASFRPTGTAASGA
jgi:hypothetical protein